MSLRNARPIVRPPAPMPGPPMSVQLCGDTALVIIRISSFSCVAFGDDFAQPASAGAAAGWPNAVVPAVVPVEVPPFSPYGVISGVGGVYGAPGGAPRV